MMSLHSDKFLHHITIVGSSVIEPGGTNALKLNEANFARLYGNLEDAREVYLILRPRKKLRPASEECVIQMLTGGQDQIQKCNARIANES